MGKRVPKALLDQIKQAVPPDAEVVPLTFRHEDEDYNIAVFVTEGTDAKPLQDWLFDLIFDYDDAHRTTTLCYVWPTGERPHIVAA